MLVRNGSRRVAAVVMSVAVLGAVTGSFSAAVAQDGSGSSQSDRPSYEKPSSEKPSWEKPSSEKPQGQKGEKPQGQQSQGQKGEKRGGELGQVFRANDINREQARAIKDAFQAEKKNIGKTMKAEFWASMAAKGYVTQEQAALLLAEGPDAMKELIKSGEVSKENAQAIWAAMKNTPKPAVIAMKRALTGLVADGTLSQDQADAVMEFWVKKVNGSESGRHEKPAGQSRPEKPSDDSKDESVSDDSKDESVSDDSKDESEHEDEHGDESEDESEEESEDATESEDERE